MPQPLRTVICRQETFPPNWQIFYWEIIFPQHSWDRETVRLTANSVKNFASRPTVQRKSSCFQISQSGRRAFMRRLDNEPDNVNLQFQDSGQQKSIDRGCLICSDA